MQMSLESGKVMSFLRIWKPGMFILVCRVRRDSCMHRTWSPARCCRSGSEERVPLQFHCRIRRGNFGDCLC